MNSTSDSTVNISYNKKQINEDTLIEEEYLSKERFKVALRELLDY